MTELSVSTNTGVISRLNRCKDKINLLIKYAVKSQQKQLILKVRPHSLTLILKATFFLFTVLTLLYKFHISVIIC